jgi:2-isopropylmalate synthase
MKKIRILDTTLRDGEQSAGVSLSPSEKLEIARKLQELNVDVIEVGFPASNSEDFAAAEMISKEIMGPKICGFARMKKEDIDVTYDAIKYASSPRIHVFIATSQIHMEKKLKKTPEQILEMIRSGIEYSISKGFEVEFSPEDASRSDEAYLIDAIRTAVDAGASVINITDTVGFSQPYEFYQRVKKIYDVFCNDIDNGKFELSVHCHNDLGNAVANTLAGISAGATQAECTINGIGERAGNASLEEVVMNLKTRADFYKAFTQIYTPKLFDCSQFVAELTKMELAYNKPIVGKNAFSHESGIHQHGISADRRTYEIMNPADVGWQGESFVYGKHSGKANKGVVGVG